MTTTVTMSLERYKELESKEKVFDKMKDNEVFFVRVAYGSDYLFYNYASEAIEDIKKDIEQVQKYAESWRQKAIK